MRAATPVRDGHVQRGGEHSFFEVYGDDDQAGVMLMPDSIMQRA